MKIKLNSAEIDVADHLTVKELKAEKSFRKTGVAVAVNGKIVPVSEHANFRLHDGDEVIVIGAAYGG